MKYLENVQLEALAAALSRVTIKCRLDCRIEAYSCKMIETDKRAWRDFLEASGTSPHQHSALSPAIREIQWQPQFGSPSAGSLRCRSLSGSDNESGVIKVDSISTKLLFHLVSLMNATFNDYDFSGARGENFHRVQSLELDRLCTRLIDVDNGLPQRQQKHYRITVPQAFTGIELCHWLFERMHLDDISEAVHMANLLQMHGYLFTVIDRDAPIRDDTTLYRLQIPYFWPTHSGQPDSIEYGMLTQLVQSLITAIYLCKRLMRNEQRHGLETYEADAYNRQLELWGHMWDYITVQAETQLKLQKEKKKSDKAVFDSQERAYWRVFRPPPSVATLEELYTKTQPKMRKKTAKHYEQEIERMKSALKTKKYFAAGNSTMQHVQWCEQYQEYDPFITSCQPSNPWISEDPAYWNLNADNVDVPTERRVKRWSFSVHELVKDPIGRQVLESFLEIEFSSENLRFWMAIQDLKFSANSEVQQKIDYLHSEYLAAGATCQVNIDNKTLDTALKAMNDTSRPLRWCFNAPESEIFTLMGRDSYLRFIRSDIYNKVLNEAKQQGTKRSWKNILSTGPKKVSLPASRNNRLTREDSQAVMVGQSTTLAAKSTYNEQQVQLLSQHSSNNR